jgi:hypothetical protein
LLADRVNEQPLSESRSSRIAFWIVASLGVVASAVAWTWYGATQEEAQSEQSKALSAGTSMAGFAEVLGGVPLVLAHVVGLGLLLVFGWRGYRMRGIVFAIAAVAVASIIGICCAQLVWAGTLFELGVNNNTYVP